MSKDHEEALRRLLDREAIRDLPHRYALCIWTKDAEGAAGLFTETGWMDAGNGTAIRGRAALVAVYRHAFGASDSHPFVHNCVIELAGDTATGRCCLDLRVNVGGRILMGSGEYRDAYVRTEDGWLFASRTLRMHYQVPVATVTNPERQAPGS